MDHASLSGGFADPPQQSAVAFRGIMQAMARPGTICDVSGAVAPAPLSVAAGTALLTLCDPDTGVHLAGVCDTREVRDWITFQTGAPFVAAEVADFVVGRWDDIPLSALKIGTPEYPDRSATVVVEMPDLRAECATLTGPGIKERAALNLPNVAAFQRNAALFPLGLDFIFTYGAQMAALPRSTKVV
ncbi:phosphonate C-P lyase system protein PhnH [Tateyamaria omphalii]|uniref:phosphonate C-P lyase system protein PhnH n=1 Tax=Tateyamaria omphalii TaxID=299262 RepID=UPI001C9974D1|nr:phosphonate C-P lyase system protein PhnH [Tateyamaria omphalii]MBY5934702.1 phosphonate C-P lyase system protein PhnH [Tateyamaria omphalii]